MTGPDGGRRRRRWSAGVAIAAVVCGIAAGARPGVAQEAVPAELTLEAAVEIARERNPAFLRQLGAVDAAEHGERQSLGALLPSLNANVGFNANTTRNKTAVDELGRPLEEADFVENTTSTASQGVSGSVALFSLENVRGYHASRARTAAEEAGLELEAARLRTRVGTAFYEVVQRERLVAVEEQGLETARQQLEAIRKLLRVAAKQPTDVLGAELDLARAEQALRQARGEARKARLALREQMGVPMETEFELAEGFPAVFDPSGLDVASLVQRGARSSPRLRQQLATVEAAERSLSAARAARYPTLNGTYSYGRGTSEAEYGALGRFDLPNSGWGFGFSVGLPLFDRFQTSGAIGRASVEADNARESLREARLGLEREIRSALIDLENAHEGVRLAERSAEIARERLRQGQEQYRIGTLQDYTALQQMIDAVNLEARRVIDAYYRFAAALLTLEEKVGGPSGG